jgi:hypothetical protein
MLYRIFPRRAPRVVSMIASLVLVLAAVVAMAGSASAQAIPVSRPNSSDANTGRLLRPLTSAEIQREREKQAEVTAWLAQTHHGMVLPTSANTTFSRYCLVDPDTNQCVIFTSHSLGGMYTQEPYDEPNWCGPSSATAVMMHWNYNGVVNTGNKTVRNNANTGYETYSGAQGYMAWIANLMYISADNHYGVSYVPYSNGAPIGWLKDGLNVATGTNYYIVVTSSTKAADMEGNVEYDISHDGHPMVYLANARYLPEWNVSYTVNHYVEGYGWGYYSDNTSLHYDLYADAISASDSRATAGDYTWDENSMYYAVQQSYNDYIV